MSSVRLLLSGQLRPFLGVLFLLSSSTIMVSSLTGCEQKQPSESHSAQPAVVSVMNMTTQSVPFSIELPATLSGAKEVEIRAQISGILKTRNFSEGDKVKAGQSLFSLDSKTYAAEMAQSKADLNAATVRLKQAQREVKRIQPLREKNSISTSISLQGLYKTARKSEAGAITTASPIATPEAPGTPTNFASAAC